MVYRPTRQQAWLVQMSRQLVALDNASRAQIMLLLCDGEKSVGTLADAVGLSQSSLSQHLLKLRQIGAVNVRRQAQWRFYSVNGAFLDRLMDNLELFAEGRSRKQACRQTGR